MDIIDIMLAKALTPQGQVETYAAKARRAAQDATTAADNATAAAQTLSDAAQAKADAEAALATVQQALEAIDNSGSTIDVATVDTEIKKVRVNTNVVDGQAAKTLQVITTYPDNTLNTQNITKLYTSTGANEDGAMTQKAITNALEDKADVSYVVSSLADKADNSAVSTALAAKADKTYVDTKIAQIPSGGNGNISVNTNLGTENSGKLVVVGEDGNITAGVVNEDELIEALIMNGGYTAKNAVGLTIDYDNKSFTRTQQAVGKSMGTDFDAFTMYGGRRRCNVADDGTINAFYGEAEYKDDGTNGQVMVYQPKFYYQRAPLQTEGNRVGKIVNRESIVVSSVAQAGFKLHPLFIDTNGEELDYVLLSAYEGGILDVSLNSRYATTIPDADFSNDLMISAASAKPITGSSQLTLERAEQLATNRGTGWHIFNMAAESANQMLELVEFGTLNGQAALGKGICSLESSGTQNQAALTGSTSELGNASGAAASTTFEHNNGERFTSSTDGQVAISYRGLENPWGNTWNMVAGLLIAGDGAKNGGVPYICNSFNYSYSNVTSAYESVEFSLPNTNGWISALGYGNKNYDWVLMPAEADSSANSALPIGDNGWFDANLNGTRMAVIGGSWSFGESDGPFYYGCDKQPTDSTYRSYGARLMFIPTKNSIYTANIAKWQEEMGG